MNRRPFLGAAAVAVLPVPAVASFSVCSVTLRVTDEASPAVADAIRRLAESLRRAPVLRMPEGSTVEWLEIGGDNAR